MVVGEFGFDCVAQYRHQDQQPAGSVSCLSAPDLRCILTYMHLMQHAVPMGCGFTTVHESPKGTR